MAAASFEAELAAIARQLEFDSAIEFRFAQRSFHVEQSPWSLPAHLDVAPRERLVHAVSLVLYYGAYIRGGGFAESNSQTEFYLIPENLMPDGEFVESLSRANQTRRSLEHGWKLIHHQADNTIHVAKAGRFRTAAAGQYQPGSAIAFQANEPLYSLRILREERDAMPMFYFAHSESLPNQCDDMDNARFYFHCDASSVVDVLRSVTASLNRYQVPFRIKCLNHPRLYRRCDALVLYIEKRYVEFVARCLTALDDQGALKLFDGVPLFCKSLIGGIGFAEDPGDGQSFGQHRCRMLAEAFLDARESGCLRDDGVLTVIRERFRMAGLDFCSPHLNAGSVDRYRFPARASNGSDVGSAKEPDSRYFQSAEAIGRLLVREAIWADDRCNWLVQCETTTNGFTKTSVTACAHGLANGVCGVGLFLARLFAVNEDPLVAEVVAGVSRLLIRAMSNETNCRHVAAALMEMTMTARLAAEEQAAIKCSRRLQINRSAGPPRIQGSKNRINQGGTAALLATNQIQRWEIEPARCACFADPKVGDELISAGLTDPICEDAARLIADYVLEQTEHHGQPWRGSIGREFPPLGLADGLAGIGHFLLRLDRPRDCPPIVRS